MEIIRVLMPIFLSIVEMVLNSLSGKMGFEEFQRKLADKLHEVGREITKQVLEELDQQIKNDKRKRSGWQVCRTGDSKEIVTCFGAVSYKRTYYRHKETGEYAYLVDKQVGYTNHMRVDNNVKAKLVAGAGELAYRKSAQKVAQECGGVTVSGQTVLRAVREFEQPINPKPDERKRVKTLYIEADEDHVASQHGRAMEVRLVYIHEGWQQEEKRRSLINPIYLSSVDEDADTFWERVWETVDARYDIDQIETVNILGDGAAWIKSAVQVFPKAKFILDRFHLMKYIRRAVGGNHEQGKALRGALRFGNREKAQEIIKELLAAAATESRKQAILEAWRYIQNNWDGITELYRKKEVKCSAEGHVSHVLSARLSSRPMGWSREGAKHMANIRVCQANGQEVAEEYLNQQRIRSQALPVLTIAEETIEKQRNSLKAAREVLDNIPVLKGPKSFLYEALQGLSLALA
ncbi:ISLre2 family transposase ISAmde2 [Sporomusa carbonis]|uniref:ISLre2 family transposase n=1 Tax=Sporomusa carbonis TaxID=3076075 RepID=UPI003A74FE56